LIWIDLSIILRSTPRWARAGVAFLYFSGPLIDF